MKSTALKQLLAVGAIALLCVGLIYFAWLQLSAAVYANAVSKTTLKVQQATGEGLQSDFRLATKMAEKLARNPVATSQHITQVYQLNAWVQHVTQAPLKEALSFSSDASLLEISRDLRPTWPHTYLMLAQATQSDAEKQKLLRLALRFGAATPQVILYEIQLGFEQWDQLHRQQQAELASLLLSTVMSYKNKLLLNEQLPYTQSREKICNLLAFNKIYLTNCPSHVNEQHQ